MAWGRLYLKRAAPTNRAVWPAPCGRLYIAAMYKTLSPGAIQIGAKNLNEGLAVARIGRFDGLEFSASEIADLVDQQGAAAVKQTFADAGVRPALFGLPVDWRTSEENWKRDLGALP